jgi:hypothetical protein
MSNKFIQHLAVRRHEESPFRNLDACLSLKLLNDTAATAEINVEWEILIKKISQGFRCHDLFLGKILAFAQRHKKTTKLKTNHNLSNIQTRYLLNRSLEQYCHIRLLDACRQKGR